MSDLFYRPDLKPKRDYMSDAEIERLKTEFDNTGDPGSNDPGQDSDEDLWTGIGEDEDFRDDAEELLEKIDDILDVITIMPPDIIDALTPSIDEIRKDIEEISRTPSDDIVGNFPQPPETIPPERFKPEEPDRNGPSLFPDNDSIPIIVVPPPPLRIVIDNNFLIDKTEIYKEFVNRLRLAIEMYMGELLYISSVGGFPSYKDLFYNYRISAKELPPNYRHIGDGIVRSQIERGQKAKFFKKMYNIDQTIYHLRANKAAHELRKRYYDTKFTGSNSYLDTQRNDLLRADRASYDKKYEQNMYNFYKYLNSAVILVDEVLQTFVKESKGKAILNKEGVDVSKGHREEIELSEKIKKKREKERKKREKETSKAEKERLERYANAGRNPNGNILGGTGDVGGYGSESQIIPSGDNATIVELAQQWSQTRGKGSSNPVKYSMSKRGSDMELKQYGDCSSFTRRVFLDAGKGEIGLNTASQITNKKGKFFTDRGQLEPGDLLFFSPTGSHAWPVKLPNGKSSSVAHVAIYIGGTKYIDLSYGIGTISTQDFSSGTPKKLMDSTFIGAMRH